MRRLHNGRLTRRAKQRQLPNRPHKLRYERSCGKYQYGYNGYCANCLGDPNYHRYPKPFEFKLLSSVNIKIETTHMYK